MRQASHAPVGIPLGILAGVWALLACSDPVGLSERTEVHFFVSPQDVDPGGSFTATLTIENDSRGPLKLTSGMGCISLLAVDEIPWDDPVEGTRFACLAVLTDYRFRPGETRSWSWDLVAETESGQPLPPGDYHLEARLNVADLEHPRAVFRVR